MKYILLHSKANILVVDDEEKLDKFWPIRHDLPDLKAVIQFTGTDKMQTYIGPFKLYQGHKGFAYPTGVQA